MLEASNSISIGRPVGEVFAVLANSENDLRWRRGVVEMKRISGDGRGAHYHQVVRGPGGRRVSADIEITDFEPDRLIGFRTLAGPICPVGRYELRPGDTGTTVTFTLQAEVGGIKRLFMAPMVRRTMASEVAALSEFKRVLESDTA
ncbi:MAG TPA: SRPBCC family protein [Candidatus Binatia bacterium]|nr:SRPBCC family protein [Candidatus Binatia bacterium]